MKKYLRDIFLNSRFKNDENNEKIDFYFKENQEYFLIEYFSIEELNNFKKDKKTNKLVNFIDYLKKNDSDNNFDDIEKNTSLIILFKVDDLKEGFLEHKNQIMKIEEDEYFFRKYVIIYDDAGEEDIMNFNNIIDLNKGLNGINLEEFREDSFINSGWYLILQLFIKLPFLKPDIVKADFINLGADISKEINKKKVKNLNKYILEEEYSKVLGDDFFLELEESILDVNNTEVDTILDAINLIDEN